MWGSEVLPPLNVDGTYRIVYTTYLVIVTSVLRSSSPSLPTTTLHTALPSQLIVHLAIVAGFDPPWALALGEIYLEEWGVSFC